MQEALAASDELYICLASKLGTSLGILNMVL